MPSSLLRAVTWTVGSRRRVRAVVYPAGPRTVLVTTSEGDVSARRLRFPDHAIIRVEARRRDGAWAPTGFPYPSRVSMAVVGLDAPPTSTSVRAYHLGLPSHMDNGRVCLGEDDTDWDALARPSDDWVRRAYWSTSYRAGLMENYPGDVVEMDTSLHLAKLVWTRRLGWLGWVRPREISVTNVDSPTLDDVAGALADNVVAPHWYRRGVEERDP